MYPVSSWFGLQWAPRLLLDRSQTQLSRSILTQVRGRLLLALRLPAKSAESSLEVAQRLHDIGLLISALGQNIVRQEALAKVHGVERLGQGNSEGVLRPRDTWRVSAFQSCGAAAPSLAAEETRPRNFLFAQLLLLRHVLLELIRNLALEAEKGSAEVLEDLARAEAVAGRVVRGVHRVLDHKLLLVHLRQLVE